ncbi:MAG: UDP-3-O-(3-hydroxymyristoyl)glucosamine N-acyltransferase [Verrucomicrobia bacterium]|nr:UDP-3-O-(3-hydroxymyristoyl)glucosamine N-acyltransferase [Verrucomicrobiota bacterium]
MRRTAREISQLLDGELVGNGDAVVTGLRGLQHAGAGDATFLARPTFAALARTSQATVILVSRDWKEPVPATLIRVDNPSAAFQRLVEMEAPPELKFEPGIHPTAVIAADVKLGRDVSVQPCAVIEAGAVIGDGTVIGAHSYIGHGVRVGADCVLWARVIIRERCVIGDRVIIHCGAVIGADGFGYVNNGAGHQKVRQLGIVEIEDDVEIGANTTIDRARFDRTLIKQGAKIDNLVQIGHNVVVGRHAILCGQVGISGSTVIGDHAILAGQVGVADHVTIGEGAIILAQSGIHADVPPKAKMFGTPAVAHSLAQRVALLRARLPKLFTRVRDLEKRFGIETEPDTE